MKNIHNINIDSVDYELHFSKYTGEITLLLTGGYSRKVGSIVKAFSTVNYDDAAHWATFDGNDLDELDNFSTTQDVDIDVPVFKLAREVMNKVVGWVNSEKPGRFHFKPSTTRKELIYDRFAKILNKRVGDSYYYQTIGSSHHWFRK